MVHREAPHSEWEGEENTKGADRQDDANDVNHINNHAEQQGLHGEAALSHVRVEHNRLGTLEESEDENEPGEGRAAMYKGVHNFINLTISNENFR